MSHPSRRKMCVFWHVDMCVLHFNVIACRDELSDCVNGKTKGDCYNNATRHLPTVEPTLKWSAATLACACSRRPTTIWWLLARLVMARPVTVVFGWEETYMRLSGRWYKGQAETLLRTFTLGSLLLKDEVPVPGFHLCQQVRHQHRH